ncbi:ComF family protein [Ornithinimicrobium sp. F0845]|uniref:phosphoribosyltransferase family protein n=1 Tax=Ornithinimicrobium sp. F0845 TaxID=2926412 RepID=UPI001FF3D317|nr:phosphoribosyltransferase family protein [Ornithinimicrobium sp. F0845]MCK0111397.1 ComF family protein [Ornithinimicrobium sp. F0845]
MPGGLLNGLRDGLLAAAGDLVLPTRCGGCDRQGMPWCADCGRALAGAPAPHRWMPTPAPPGLPVVWTALAYQGAVRAGLVNWKDNGRRDLARVLAPPLTEALLAALLACPDGRPVVLVPTPSARSNVRRRGDRPLQSLIRRALAALPPADRPRVVPALRLARRVADQAGLDSQDRARNLAGAMTVAPRFVQQVRGGCCVVVDDVITTGATLTEAARALSAAGATGVLAATVAATQRHTGPASPVVATAEDHRLGSVPPFPLTGPEQRVATFAPLGGGDTEPRLTFRREPG